VSGKRLQKKREAAKRPYTSGGLYFILAFLNGKPDEPKTPLQVFRPDNSSKKMRLVSDVWTRRIFLKSADFIVVGKMGGHLANSGQWPQRMVGENSISLCRNKEHLKEANERGFQLQCAEILAVRNFNALCHVVWGDGFAGRNDERAVGPDLSG
jgi:hypothetical protein